MGVKTHHWEDFLLDESRERNELKEESKVDLFQLKSDNWLAIRILSLPGEKKGGGVLRTEETKRPREIVC